MTKLTAEEVAEIQQVLTDVRKKYDCEMIVMAIHRQDNVEYFRHAERGFWEETAKYLLKCLNFGIDSLNQKMRDQAKRNRDGPECWVLAMSLIQGFSTQTGQDASHLFQRVRSVRI